MSIQKVLKGIAYVSAWVLVWGTVGSIIDAGLLNVDLYDLGSIGQKSIFIVVAIICMAGGWSLYSEVLGRSDKDN